MLTVLTATIPERELRLSIAMQSVAKQSRQVDAHIVSCRAPFGPSPPHQATQLNQCLLAAASDYVAVLDDDNWWLPGHAATLLAVAEVVDAEVFYSFDRDGVLPQKNVNGWTQEALVGTLEKENLIDGGAAIIKRSALVSAGGFPTQWEGSFLHDGGHYANSEANYADWELWRRLAHSGARFRCVPVPTWVYTTALPKRMQTGLG